MSENDEYEDDGMTFEERQRWIMEHLDRCLLGTYKLYNENDLTVERLHQWGEHRVGSVRVLEN